MPGADSLETSTPWAPIIPDVTLADGCRLRQLPPDEWWKLAESAGPFQGTELPAVDTCAFLVLEDPSGTVVKHWAAFDAVQIDGLWSREDYRGHHDRLFLGAMITLLQRKDVRYAHAIVREADLDVMGELAAKVGFTDQGRAFAGPIPEREDA